MRKLISLAILATGGALLSSSCGDGESTHIAASETGDEVSGGQGGAADGAAGEGKGSAGEGGSGPEAHEPNCEQGEGELEGLKLTPFLTDIPEAVFVGPQPGDAHRLFVVQRTGKVVIVEDGERLPDPFITVAVQATYAEKGLLGLAFHPDYQDNGLFYLYYVEATDDPEAEGDVVVAEYERDPDDPNLALPEPRRELIRLPQPTAKHKAGMILFDADKRLYIAVGNAGEPTWSADPSTRYGKVLRIDPNPEAETYSIPGDNPLKSGWAPEVLEYGLRNPWRMSMDPCTGDLYIADVGSEDFEEVNVAPADEHGRDFGYMQMEGPTCQPNMPDCVTTGKIVPVGGYPHTDRRCAIIGGYVYRGHAIPALRGAYLYADLCSGRMYMLRYEDGEPRDEREITEMINPDRIAGFSSFGTDAAGELYLISRREETIYRIEAD